ncbi:uncharacterized protein N7518_009497 [Penicillium psychrosexuale]|uniref:uncharacterized protein n=1 Tax=Penicillium psychrosexuale TaxID=1002107 RepID=UPI0025453C09|nr:uncharacterized protein N7518_009497 [Penicillium psychrosexuale]KAJ5783820.1 hypothetical protein N7518_009497 [Penicillium psychrosexuale]
MAANWTGPCWADKTPSKERQIHTSALLDIIQRHIPFAYIIDVPNSTSGPTDLLRLGISQKALIQRSTPQASDLQTQKLQ